MENDRNTLADTVADRWWYHTLDLGNGLVTPGWFDTRSIATRVPFGDLTGKRCLDVGTFDGFWAFEMERRGATQVVALDALDPAEWDWPGSASEEDKRSAFSDRHDQGRGFTIAKEALGSAVQRVDRSVYRVADGDLGTFDVVYVGSLLMHLRDPVLALERIRRVLEPDGRLVMADNIDLPLTLALPRRPVAGLEGKGRPWWWRANLAGLVQMIESAGFRIVTGPERFYMPPGEAHPRTRPTLTAFRTRVGRDGLIIRWKGDPHATLAAAPS